MAFHCAYEMTSCVARKKLPVNNVNVFAGVKYHEFCSAPLFIGLVEGWLSAQQAVALALLLSRACLEEFLEFLGLSGRKICPDSHMH
jgi:hypothetical protein